MAALFKPVLQALAAGAVLVAVPASAQLMPSAPADIAAAGADCWAVVSEGPVDEAALRQKGWSEAKMISPGKKSVQPGFRIYGKGGTGAVVMIAPEVDPRGCLIMSKARTAQDVSAVIPILFKTLKAVDPNVEVKKVSAQEVGFFSLPKAALFRLTGDPTKPGVSIQVSYTAPEKK